VRRVALDELVNNQPVDVAVPVVGRHQLGDANGVGAQVLEQVQLPVQRGRRPTRPPHHQLLSAPLCQIDLVAGTTSQRLELLDPRPGRHRPKCRLHLVTFACCWPRR